MHSRVAIFIQCIEGGFYCLGAAHNQHFSQKLLQIIPTAIFSTQFRPLTHHSCKWKNKCILIYITYLNQKPFGEYIWTLLDSKKIQQIPRNNYNK